ncbi:MAG: hypothetical protein ACREIU_16325, partial [Planctomycetota bacterium]
MLASLFLLGLADPAGPSPTEVERRFEEQATAELAAGDGVALATLLAEGRDLLPALLDRWAFAAYLRDPADLDALGRAARLREAAGGAAVPLLEIPVERVGEWRGAVARFRDAAEAPAWGELARVFESLGDPRRLALVHLNRGRALADTLEEAQAREALARAGAYAESAGDTPLLAFSLEVEAQCLRDLELHA